MLPWLLLALGCRDDDGEPEADTGGEEPSTMLVTGQADGSSSGEVAPPSRDAADQCELAPLVGAGTHYGSLRGYGSQLGGSCGEGGPDGFFRLEVPRRSDVFLRGLGAGFVPRIGVLPHGCVDEWEDRTMLCTEGVGAWLLDVAADTSLVVSVGIDPEHELLDQPPPMLGADPLDFALEVDLRNVLDEGDPCRPSDRGRCGAGTVCLPPPPPDDPEAPVGPDVCTAVAGDTCGSALDVALSPGVSLVAVDPQAPHTDAHYHSCGGSRRRDHVLRLTLPGPGPHALEVRGDRPQLGLALRRPGCLLADEIACVTDELEVPRLTAEIPDPAVLLFVELPPEPDPEDEEGTTGGAPGEEAPILLEIEVLEAPPAD